jgi:N-methylhydantoinase B
VLAADGSERQVEAIGDSTLRPGEWIRGVEAGGGGYGDPLERDPEAVLRDVLERWVTPRAAREVFGVVLAEQGGADGGVTSYTIEPAATGALRAELREAGGTRHG